MPDHTATTRALLGLTQQDLADRAGVSRRTVIRLEQSEPVSVDSARAISRALYAAAQAAVTDPAAAFGELRAAHDAIAPLHAAAIADTEDPDAADLLRAVLVAAYLRGRNSGPHNDEAPATNRDSVNNSTGPRTAHHASTG